jgi:hypothetical protein
MYNIATWIQVPRMLLLFQRQVIVGASPAVFYSAKIISEVSKSLSSDLTPKKIPKGSINLGL